MISELNAEIEKLSTIIKEKQSELSGLIAQKIEQETLQYPMHSFLGKSYIYDRPQKWNSPKYDTLTQEELVRFDYLQFNGIESGEVLNRLYEEKIYQDDAMYATFAVPDEYHCDSEDSINQKDYIRIHDIYTLLSFKVE